MVYSYNSAKTCGDIIFSNDDATVKKKGAYFASTVLGANILKDAEYEWEVEINELQGSYICIGIIENKEWGVKCTKKILKVLKVK